MSVPPPGPGDAGQVPDPNAPLDPFPNAQAPQSQTPVPPPAPPAAQQPYPQQGYPQQYPQQGYPQPAGQPGAYGHYGPPKPKMGKAITSLILGLSSIFLCLCWFITIPTSIAAIILGALGQRDVKRGTGGGNGMAIAGMVLGIVGVLLSIVAIFLWLTPDFQDAFWEGFCEEDPNYSVCENY